MHVLLAVFFFVSSMVKVHGKHPVRIVVVFFDWVACICANDRLLCLSRGGLHRHSFFLFVCFFAHARRRQDKQLSHFFCGRSAGQTRTASSWPHYLEAARMCRWNSLDLTTPK